MFVMLYMMCGDVKVEFYVVDCLRVCENFLVLCVSGYYD